MCACAFNPNVKKCVCVCVCVCVLLVLCACIRGMCACVHVCLHTFNANTQKTCVHVFNPMLSCSVNVYVRLKVRIKVSAMKIFIAKMVEIYGRFQFLKNSNTLHKTNKFKCFLGNLPFMYVVTGKVSCIWSYTRALAPSVQVTCKNTYKALLWTYPTRKLHLGCDYTDRKRTRKRKVSLIIAATECERDIECP